MTSFDDPLVIATLGLVVVTIGLLIATLVYAYFTRKLSQHMAHQVALLKRQESVLKAQVRISAVVPWAASGVQYPQNIRDRVNKILEDVERDTA